MALDLSICHGGILRSALALGTPVVSARIMSRDYRLQRVNYLSVGPSHRVPDRVVTLEMVNFGNVEWVTGEHDRLPRDKYPAGAE